MTTQTTQKAPSKPKYVAVNRGQLTWLPTDVEKLVPVDHPARAIWELVTRMDLSRFEEAIQTREGEVGRPCWEPRLLVSIWVYGYSQGVASARELERQMEYERGLQWLAGTEVINAHTLSDFRMTHKGKLNQLMEQVLAMLDKEGLIDLETVVQDGTKVRAVASSQSMHRRQTLEQRLRKAREVVGELERKGEPEGSREGRKEAAQKRAAAERLERMEQSLRQLRRLEAQAEEGAPLRVSDSEPEARKMKQADGGWAPSYNVQISTELKNRIIVGIRVSDQAGDHQELVPAVHMVQHLNGQKPRRMMADNGYSSRENVEEMARRRMELVAPWKSEESREAGALKIWRREAEYGPAAFRMAEGTGELICPEGKRLSRKKRRKHHGQWKVEYQAQASDCGRCERRGECCGVGQSGPRRVSRVEESAAMQAYLERMRKEETAQLYKRRKEVGEFPQLRMKGNWEWRRFSVRGLVKAGREAMWAAIAYNIEQWIRICWKPRFV